MLDSPHDTNIESATSLDSPTAEAFSFAPDFTRVRPNKGVGFSYLAQITVTTVPLLLGDFLALGASFVSAHFAIRLVWSNIIAGFENWIMLVGIALPSLFAMFGLYPGAGLHPVVELRKATQATLILFAILFAFACVHRMDIATIWLLAITCTSTLVLVPLLRSSSRTMSSCVSWWGQRILVFGNYDTTQQLVDYYHSNPRLGFRPVQISDCLAGEDDNDPTAETIRSERLRFLRNEHRGFWSLLSVPFAESSTALIGDHLATFPRVLVVAGGDQLPCAEKQVWDCNGRSAMLMTNRLLLPSTRVIKRVMDYVLAIVVGILFLPLIGLITLLIRATSRGPVFYAQKRIGKRNQPFWAWKFRTMRVDADQVLQKYLDSHPKLREEWERDHKLKNDPRVTLIGNFLRKTSLDELPQLWNILRGEMSLVGPRPIVTAEIPKYREAFELYTRATPGVTGLWQISGRNNTTYERRVALDSYYVRNWSPWLDLYILFRTIKVVLLRDGAY